MDTKELYEAKKFFQKSLRTLENDAKRAFHPIDNLKPSPLPVFMYLLDTVDFFSGLWAGWHDRNQKPSHDARNSEKRMIDFLENYLLYPQRNSYLIIQAYKHSVIQGSDNALFLEEKRRYLWDVKDWHNQHWQILTNSSKGVIFQIGILDIIEDLKSGIFAPSGFFEDLRIDHRIQANWTAANGLIEQQTTKQNLQSS